MALTLLYMYLISKKFVSTILYYPILFHVDIIYILFSICGFPHYECKQILLSCFKSNRFLKISHYFRRLPSFFHPPFVLSYLNKLIKNGTCERTRFIYPCWNVDFVCNKRVIYTWEMFFMKEYKRTVLYCVHIIHTYVYIWKNKWHVKRLF